MAEHVRIDRRDRGKMAAVFVQIVPADRVETMSYVRIVRAGAEKTADCAPIVPADLVIGRVVPGKAARASAGTAMIGAAGRTIIGRIESMIATAGTVGARTTMSRSTMGGVNTGMTTMTGSTTIGGTTTTLTSISMMTSTTGHGPRGRR